MSAAGMFMKRGAPPPFRRQSSAERALARASQHLQGATTGTAKRDREESSDNEDDINKYLSSLRKKTQGETSEQVPQAGRKKLSLGGDASDISLTDSSEQRSSGRAPARNKFLKSRPTPQPAPQGPQVAAPKLGTAVGGSALQRSAALAEASRLTGKYEKQKRREKRKERKMSDVSSEMSAPSEDSEAALKKRGSGGGAEALYAKSTRAKLGYLTDEESASIGKDGGKFLRKKKKGKEEEEKEAGQLTPKTKKQLRFAGIADEDEDATPRGPLMKSPKSASSHSSSLRSDRLRRSPGITESDEDMSTAELGEGLLSGSSGPLTPQSPKRRPSLKSPDTPRSAKKRVTIAETAIAMPAKEKEEEEEIGEALLDVSELSFVPEQFGASPPDSSQSEAAPVTDFSGLPETIMDAADFLDSSSDEDSSPPFAAVRSIDELSEASSVPEVESEIPSGRRRRRRSLSPRSPSSSSSSTSSTVIRSEQRPAGTSQYSDSDFDSVVSETERPTTVPGSYVEDFESATSQSEGYEQSVSHTNSSSVETTVTESFTRSIRRRRRRRRSTRESDKCVQTHEAGLEFEWDVRRTGAPLLGPAYGMAGVDLSPIAHFAVAPEALEAVTTYSPSVIALNNMLRQQLELTRNFMATQRRLYDAMSRTIAPDYSYTTLEDTKEFIRKHRPSTITMEEALREVELDI